MATLAVTPITLTGTTETGAAAAGGGDACAPGDSTFLRVNNGDAGSITVTVDSVTPSNYGVDENVAVTVAGTTIKLIGPLRAQRFAAPSDGLVHWTYSAVTSVTVSAFTI